MDWVSWLISLVGLGRDDADRVSARRTEAARINSEIASEVGQVLDLVLLARPRLLDAMRQGHPTKPEYAALCANSLDTAEQEASTLLDQSRQLAAQIETASRWLDWDMLLRRLHEMHATTRRMRPYVESIIQEFREAAARPTGAINPP